MTLWVFGYGSLMWNPEFDYQERRRACVHGFTRGFSMASVHHRGTAEHPGLVLALDPKRGGSCEGLAFRVAPKDEVEVIQALRERELISSAYIEATLPAQFDGHRQERVLAFIMDQSHAQYRGHLTLEEQAQIIAQAVGGRGPNWEYLYNTAAHLRDLGVEDPDMNWLETRVREIRGECLA